MEEKKLVRGAGILLAITSLPSSYGIGTLGDAAFQFVDLLVDLKQSYWQVLPIGPTAFGNSPYQSYSSFAGNPYLIDLDDLVREGLLESKEIRSFNWGSDAADIDYGMIYENRFKVLRMAYARFDVESEEFHNFEENEADWLDDYALYTALKRHFGDREWQSWDTAVRDRDPDTLREYQKILHNEIMFCKFCQYEFFRQWKALKAYAGSRGVRIIGDLPFYVAADSVDVWANRELFLLESDGTPRDVAGAPPDAFSTEGQKWGSPIYDWDRMEEENYAWWQKRMHKSRELFDVVRLDHFIGIVTRKEIINQCSERKERKVVQGTGKKTYGCHCGSLG